eukprot:GHVQ01004867.1.p1 GENE.GHVQ01004867.1~~GHVQ01004867.1.p1  ORF type:complete len:1764 (-),score=219.36 GHVQ01004867.1:383-5464(-)
MARLLLVDPVIHPELAWTIRDCLLALEEEGWSLRIQGPDVAFVRRLNDGSAKESVRSTVKTVELYKELSRRLINHKADVRRLRKHDLHVGREMIFEALTNAQDVREVCTPELLEGLMGYLGGDSRAEPYLVGRVKTTMEDAFFRSREEGKHLLTLTNCIDMQSLLCHLQLDRAELLKRVSTTGLLVCVECRQKLADFGCATCHDFLCNYCFYELHKAGNRLDHQGVFVEQFVCSECESRRAIIRCEDCCDLFCFECFRASHLTTKRGKHGVTLAEIQFCHECDDNPATFACQECENIMCRQCCRDIHRKGARQNHSIFGLRQAVNSKKLCANNFATVRRVLDQNVKKVFSLSPWYKFFNDQLKPYWYNFDTKATSCGTLEHSDLVKNASQTAEPFVLQHAMKSALFDLPQPSPVQLVPPNKPVPPEDFVYSNHGQKDPIAQMDRLSGQPTPKIVISEPAVGAAFEGEDGDDDEDYNPLEEMARETVVSEDAANPVDLPPAVGEKDTSELGETQAPVMAVTSHGPDMEGDKQLAGKVSASKHSEKSRYLPRLPMQSRICRENERRIESRYQKIVLDDYWRRLESYAQVTATASSDDIAESRAGQQSKDKQPSDLGCQDVFEEASSCHPAHPVGEPITLQSYVPKYFEALSSDGHLDESVDWAMLRIPVTICYSAWTHNGKLQVHLEYFVDDDALRRIKLLSLNDTPPATPARTSSEQCLAPSCSPLGQCKPRPVSCEMSEIVEPHSLYVPLDCVVDVRCSSVDYCSVNLRLDAVGLQQRQKAAVRVQKTWRGVIGRKKAHRQRQAHEKNFLPSLHKIGADVAGDSDDSDIDGGICGNDEQFLNSRDEENTDIVDLHELASHTVNELTEYGARVTESSSSARNISQTNGHYTKILTTTSCEESRETEHSGDSQTGFVIEGHTISSHSAQDLDINRTVTASWASPIDNCGIQDHIRHCSAVRIQRKFRRLSASRVWWRDECVGCESVREVMDSPELLIKATANTDMLSGEGPVDSSNATCSDSIKAGARDHVDDAQKASTFISTSPPESLLGDRVVQGRRLQPAAMEGALSAASHVDSSTQTEQIPDDSTTSHNVGSTLLVPRSVQDTDNTDGIKKLAHTTSSQTGSYGSLPQKKLIASQYRKRTLQKRGRARGSVCKQKCREHTTVPVDAHTDDRPHRLVTIPLQHSQDTSPSLHKIESEEEVKNTDCQKQQPMFGGSHQGRNGSGGTLIQRDVIVIDQHHIHHHHHLHHYPTRQAKAHYEKTASVSAVQHTSEVLHEDYLRDCKLPSSIRQINQSSKQNNKSTTKRRGKDQSQGDEPLLILTDTCLSSANNNSSEVSRSEGAVPSLSPLLLASTSNQDYMTRIHELSSQQRLKLSPYQITQHAPRYRRVLLMSSEYGVQPLPIPGTINSPRRKIPPLTAAQKNKHSVDTPNACIPASSNTTSSSRSETVCPLNDHETDVHSDSLKSPRGPLITDHDVDVAEHSKREPASGVASDEGEDSKIRSKTVTSYWEAICPISPKRVVLHHHIHHESGVGATSTMRKPRPEETSSSQKETESASRDDGLPLSHSHRGDHYDKTSQPQKLPKTEGSDRRARRGRQEGSTVKPHPPRVCRARADGGSSHRGEKKENRSAIHEEPDPSKDFTQASPSMIEPEVSGPATALTEMRRRQREMDFLIKRPNTMLGRKLFPAIKRSK